MDRIKKALWEDANPGKPFPKGDFFAALHLSRKPLIGDKTIYEKEGNVSWTEADEDGSKYGHELNGLPVMHFPKEVWENNPRKVLGAWLKKWTGAELKDDVTQEQAREGLRRINRSFSQRKDEDAS